MAGTSVGVDGGIVDVGRNAISGVGAACWHATRKRTQPIRIFFMSLIWKCCMIWFTSYLSFNVQIPSRVPLNETGNKTQMPGALFQVIVFWSKKIASS